MLTSKLARLFWSKVCSTPPEMFSEPYFITTLAKMALMIYRREGKTEARQFIHLCRLSALV